MGFIRSYIGKSGLLTLPLLLLGSLLLSSCFHDDDDASSDTTAPTAEIHFPGYVGLTDGDTVLVTGASTDASTITRVRVAGVDATSTDGFATWRAVVPLEPGDNELAVETTDEFSNVDEAAATLNIESSSELNPAAIALDSANNRLLSLEKYTRAVVAIDLDSGKQSILSNDTSSPDGPSNPWATWEPRGIVLDSGRNRALLLIGVAVVAVDLDTGARSLLSLAANSINPGNDPLDIVLDSSNDRALLVVTGAVVAVDLETGVQSVLSPPPNTDGSFNLVNSLTSITLDASSNRALVTDAGQNALVAVDLENGLRTIISSQPDSGGPILGFDPLRLNFSRDLVLDAARNRVLVSNAGSNNLLAIDLTTAIRSNFSDRDIPDTRYPFEYLSGIALDPVTNRALVLDSAAGIVAVELDTGARSVAYARATPETTNAFAWPSGIAIDTTSNRALVVDNKLQAVLAMDLMTGARTILSDNTIPDANNPFNSPFGITLDSANNRALVLSWSGVLAVDLETGMRTILSDDNIPNATNIALDVADNRALVTTQGTRGCDIIIPCVSSSLMSVDLDSGARTLLSDQTTPDDTNPFSLPLDVDLDYANNHALVVDAERMSLIAVNLKSGARTVLSDPETPDTNNPFREPTSIAVDSARNRALVVDRLPPFLYITASITSVDLETGARSILSDGITPDAHNVFNAASDIVVDTARNRALVVDSRLRAVIAVELTTGERVIVSK